MNASSVPAFLRPSQNKRFDVKIVCRSNNLNIIFIPCQVGEGLSRGT